jgi:hypothetical protein
MCKDEYIKDDGIVKCENCVNDCYRAENEKTGCRTGQDCWFEEVERRKLKTAETEDIPFKVVPLKTKFSETGKTPLEIEIGVNVALARGCKLIINNSTYLGFKSLGFDITKHEITVFSDNSSVVIEYYEESNIIVSYGRESVKITIEAL